MALNGCKEIPDHTKSSPNPEVQAGATASSNRVLVESFHFGRVIADSSERLSHTYNIKNSTNAPVRVLNVTNGMRCCGDVEAGPSQVITPGQVFSVKVDLRPSKIGPLRHWVSVKTEGPDPQEYRFDTLAEVLAEVRIEAEEASVPVVAPGQEFQSRFRLIRVLEENDQPGDLSVNPYTLHLAGTDAKVAWDGPPRRRRIEADLSEWVYPFVVSLKAEDNSGADTCRLEVRNGSQTALQYPLRWRVKAWIQADPPLLTLNGQTSQQTLVLQGPDGSNFEIKSASSQYPGLRVQPRESHGSRHLLDVQLNSDPAKRSGRLAHIDIQTTLDAQKRVRVPVLLTPASSTP